jgi:hypothetical protein
MRLQQTNKVNYNFDFEELLLGILSGREDWEGIVIFLFLTFIIIFFFWGGGGAGGAIEFPA